MYPHFLPPKDIATKSPRKWSRTDARTYFNWLLEARDRRVAHLLEFCAIDARSSDEDKLVSIQDKFERLISDGELYQKSPNGSELTREGYAFAADMGLLVADVIIGRGKGSVRWTILDRPKSNISYNLPVLVGFRLSHLDPIAGSLTDAHWIIEGNAAPHAWLKVAEFWTDSISK